MTTALSVREASKIFGGQVALDHVSLDVAPGEVRALVGQNGCGKSTLIKILAGFHEPEPGTEGVSGSVDPDAPITPEPTSVADATARIAMVTRWLRQRDATNPAPYLMLRGFRWGELRANAPEVDPRLLDGTRSGSVGINHAVVQVASTGLPFGGWGLSGVGTGHGIYGFLAFTHERAVYQQLFPGASEWLHPPFTPRKRRWIAAILRWL